MKTVFTVALLAICATLCFGFSVSDNHVQVERIILVHRHGARTPIANISGACGKEPCGELSAAGESMLRSLGRHLRETYAFLPNTYDLGAFANHADTIDRTIQSSAAMLHGLFEFNESYQFYPAIKTVKSSYTAMLPWNSYPIYLLHTATTADSLGDYALRTYLGKPGYPTSEEIIAVGNETKNTYCSLGLNPCFSVSYDFLTVMITLGKFDEYPTAVSVWSKYQKLFNVIMRLQQYDYDAVVANTSFFEDAGYPGSYLAQEIAESALHSGPALHEWSGHDTTLMPLFVALGNTTFVYPDFATTLIFEIFSKNGTKQLRAKLGSPEQTPGDHPYTFGDFALQCLDQGNRQYTVTSEGCPVNDFRRYIESRSNPAPLGVCGVLESDKEYNLCPGSNTTAAPPDTTCYIFRNTCPYSACGTSRYMTKNLGCSDLSGDL